MSGGRVACGAEMLVASFRNLWVGVGSWQTVVSHHTLTRLCSFCSFLLLTSLPELLVRNSPGLALTGDEGPHHEIWQFAVTDTWRSLVKRFGRFSSSTRVNVLALLLQPSMVENVPADLFIGESLARCLGTALTVSHGATLGVLGAGRLLLQLSATCAERARYLDESGVSLRCWEVLRLLTHASTPSDPQLGREVQRSLLTGLSIMGERGSQKRSNCVRTRSFYFSGTSFVCYCSHIFATAQQSAAPFTNRS